ncbi:hypothetical protein M378DRAFT_16903 [Amanita muscaria Koide BX008]|uniref:Uncharacterized protein n=1 Tax=Amanita muscaria (strain Koide BX008) TaxID=946122 RepID=A0A0C2W687_AMAMK|nr:hypothetical protein M378DRAFT_16903 [Amanita muscaria Koide BX008]
MTEGEFADSLTTDEGREPWWLEVHYPAITFFSSSFDLFLSEGKDKEYLMFYLITILFTQLCAFLSDFW